MTFELYVYYENHLPRTALSFRTRSGLARTREIMMLHNIIPDDVFSSHEEIIQKKKETRISTHCIARYYNYV